MATAQLISKGNKCLADRESIPQAPLWHMGKVAVFESQESFDFLQNTIDYLTCKGKLGKVFTENEKEFMKEIFEALFWGGQYHGYKEASNLANHYVNGDGKIYTVNPQVYKESVIVRNSVTAMKSYIHSLLQDRKPISMLASSDRGFLGSQQAATLKQGIRDVDSQGYILNDGALLVEQSNQRLKNTDHRFHLQMSTTKNANNFLSIWRVESFYDFEPFSKGYITDIPLSESFVLKLPDGLSHYLTKISVAKDFKYISTWQEMWK